jgi:asparagine synthetase B (glutamine-hydrolysing)
MTYPEGDPGREDHFITQTTGRWGILPHWIQSSTVPILERAVEGAAVREQPFAHPFENWNRALAGAGRSLGARVLLDGYGGDQLFGGSLGYLAWLLRHGTPGEFLEHWRRIIARVNWRSQFRSILLPHLPLWLRQMVRAARGGLGLRGLFQQVPAPWIRSDFAERHDLAGRQERLAPPGEAARYPNAEIGAYLRSPFFATMLSATGGFCLEAGLEARSPIYDQRIIAFAAGRPWQERNLAGESKRLLREAVQGLVPDEVLATRPYKTGTTGKYFMDSMRQDFPRLAKAGLARPILPELGVVDLEKLRTGLADLSARRAGPEIAAPLFFTLQTELWLQARYGRGPAA